MGKPFWEISVSAVVSALVFHFAGKLQGKTVLFSLFSLFRRHVSHFVAVSHLFASCPVVSFVPFAFATARHRVKVQSVL